MRMSSTARYAKTADQGYDTFQASTCVVAKKPVGYYPTSRSSYSAAILLDPNAEEIHRRMITGDNLVRARQERDHIHHLEHRGRTSMSHEELGQAIAAESAARDALPRGRSEVERKHFNKVRDHYNVWLWAAQREFDEIETAKRNEIDHLQTQGQSLTELAAAQLVSAEAICVSTLEGLEVADGQIRQELARGRYDYCPPALEVAEEGLGIVGARIVEVKRELALKDLATRCQKMLGNFYSNDVGRAERLVKEMEATLEQGCAQGQSSALIAHEEDLERLLSELRMQIARSLLSIESNDNPEASKLVDSLLMKVLDGSNAHLANALITFEKPFIRLKTRYYTIVNSDRELSSQQLKEVESEILAIQNKQEYMNLPKGLQKDISTFRKLVKATMDNQGN